MGRWPAQKRRVLHVGCGPNTPERLHPVFQDGGWEEVRLDIDPMVAPDIVATLTDMQAVEAGSMDAVYSSHNLEHLYPHEVPVALGEMRRVLKPSGFALITMPDLQTVAQLVVDGGLDDPAYISSAGPIAPHDIIYGRRGALARGNLFMAHRTGFTGRTLSKSLLEAGFAAMSVQRVPPAFALWAVAFQTAPTPAQMREAQAKMLPLGAA